MKRAMLLLSLIALLAGTGCRGVNRLLGQEPHGEMPDQHNINPNDFYVTGTTTKDHESVYMEISSRTLTVEIMPPGATDWTTLERVDPPFNPYQVFSIPRGGIHFGDKAYRDANGLHLYTGTPAAPAGTQYRIHTVAKS